MFEQLEEEKREEEESRRRLLRDCSLVIGALVIIGGLAYFVFRSTVKPPPSVPSAAKAAPAGPPDATRDLEIVKATMGKDVTGLRVMWSVKIRNKSKVYSYYNLKYEATFVGPDGRPLSVTADTIKDVVEPGALKTIPQFVDGIYNSNASTYNFRLVGAEAKTQ